MLGYKDVNYNYNCALSQGEQLDSAWVSKHWWCIGYIDTNWVDYPNEEVSCYSKSLTESGATVRCTVPKDKNHVTDIFPFIIQDNAISPAANAATFLLQK